MTFMLGLWQDGWDGWDPDKLCLMCEEQGLQNSFVMDLVHCMHACTMCRLLSWWVIVFSGYEMIACLPHGWHHVLSKLYGSAAAAARNLTPAKMKSKGRPRIPYSNSCLPYLIPRWRLPTHRAMPSRDIKLISLLATPCPVAPIIAACKMQPLLMQLLRGARRNFAEHLAA